MGDLGYISKAQDDLNISYNTLEDYCLDLENALTTPYKAYQDIGEFVDGKRVQLNTSVIQIENEYYSTIRPKRVCLTGERPVNVLRTEGIEYLELRCVDLDPFSPVGVRRDQLDFMDTLLMYCLLKESPPIGRDEAETIKNNHEKIINNGRDVSQIINLNGDEGTTLDFSEKILSELKEISSTLGGSVFKEDKNLWMESIDLQIKKVKNIDETLSGKVLNDLLTKNMSFREFGLKLANEHSQYFKTDQQYENLFFEEAAKASLEKQDEIDAQIEPDFESYLKEYFSQTS
jgi:glutamate--cysteine ligase